MDHTGPPIEKKNEKNIFKLFNSHVNTNNRMLKQSSWTSFKVKI